MPIPRLTSESGFTGFQDSARNESAITACPISGLASARAHSRSSDPLAQPQCLHWQGFLRRAELFCLWPFGMCHGFYAFSGTRWQGE